MDRAARLLAFPHKTPFATIRIQWSPIMVRILSVAVLVVFALPIRADDKVDEFFAAVRRGDVKAVETMLDAGIDVKSKTPYGATALHFAADKGHVEITKLLLQRKADPNAADTFYGATPLMWASMNNH